MKSFNNTANTYNSKTVGFLKAPGLFKFFMAFIFLTAFAYQTNGQGNFIGFNTAYYDNPGLLYSNEVGEDAAVNSSNGDYYVAGEYAKGTSSQGIHIARYDYAGNLLYSTNFNPAGKRESVKRILLYSTGIYLICNSLDDSTGISSLLLVRVNTTMTTVASTYFSDYHDPADAFLTSSSAIYLTCYKRTGSANELAVLKMSYASNTFSIINSYKYHYTSVSDNYEENPKQMVYHAGSIFIAGGTVDNTTGKTGTLVIKLNSNLNPYWEKASTLDSGKYVYNSIAVTSTDVYVAGSTMNNNKGMWTIKRLDKATGAKIGTETFQAGNGYSTEALKITLASSTDLIVVGYAQNTTLNKYVVEIGKYSANLSGTPTYYTTSLLNGSKINDAVSKSNGITYITGQKYVGGINSSKYMFFYGFRVLTGGDNFYRDSLVNQNGGGNKIILNTNAFSMGIAAVTGFKNNSSIAAQPTDFSMTTRFYEERIPKMGDEITPAQEISFSVYPNPASDLINITANEDIQLFKIIDLQGKTVLQGDLSEDAPIKES